MPVNGPQQHGSSGMQAPTCSGMQLSHVCMSMKHLKPQLPVLQVLAVTWLLLLLHMAQLTSTVYAGTCSYCNRRLQTGQPDSMGLYFVRSQSIQIAAHSPTGSEAGRLHDLVSPNH